MPAVTKKQKRIVMRKEDFKELFNRVADATVELGLSTGRTPTGSENLPNGSYWSDSECLISIHAADFDTKILNLESALKILKKYVK